MAPTQDEIKTGAQTPTKKAVRHNTHIDHLETICEIEQIRGSGPGGQHRNKAYTGVRLTHPPSGVVVTATERRSYPQNRAIAFERLIAKLEDMAKVRAPRKPTRVPKGVKRKRLDNKRKRSELKKSRNERIDY